MDFLTFLKVFYCVDLLQFYSDYGSVLAKCCAGVFLAFPVGGLGFVYGAVTQALVVTLCWPAFVKGQTTQARQRCGRG